MFGCYCPPPLVYSKNFSGATRIAAPVGHDRTQAAPPFWSLHISHFTAFLGSDLSLFTFVTPGSWPKPNISHEMSEGRFGLGSVAAI